MKSVILDLHEQLKSNKTNPQALVDNAKALVKEYEFTNSVITPVYNYQQAKFDPNNLLSCIPYSLKDNISTKGIRTTAGSRFLNNYIPPFNATVYELLQECGSILLYKDAMDEFGLGGSGTHCATSGLVVNPWDKTRISGGSSSGSAVNVAIGASAFAIGTDTGDSIRRPASLVGIVGYKPTYGAISRYGVLPYAPSFDHVGILSKYVADSVIVAEKLIKQDVKDSTSSNVIKDVKLENLRTLPHIRFVVIKNLLDLLDKEKVDKFNKLLAELKEEGHSVIEANLDKRILDSIIFAYKVLTYSQGFSCYSNLQGITFGENKGDVNDDYYTSLVKSRTAGIGHEVKRRFVIGAFLTSRESADNIMLAARAMRHMIQDAEVELLKQGDCVLMPTVMDIAPELENPHKPLGYDDWLSMANFSGTPSITIPFTKFNNMPWGLTISCDVYQDMKMLNIAYTLETWIGGDNE